VGCVNRARTVSMRASEKGTTTCARDLWIVDQWRGQNPFGKNEIQKRFFGFRDVKASDTSSLHRAPLAQKQLHSQREACIIYVTR
jgi:hypothetical protein